MQRGDIRLFVAFRPGENVTNEVSFTGGYPFKDGSTVTPRRRLRHLHPYPRRRRRGRMGLDRPVRRQQGGGGRCAGATAKLTGTSSRGTGTEDTFSLSGFTAAVEDAAARCR